jgi:hypothetical protein
MRGRFRVSTLVVLLALAGCETEQVSKPEALSGEFALSASIEEQVKVQAPEHDLRTYVRLYTHGPEGNVDAKYIHEHLGGMSRNKWKSGQSYWIADREMPRIFDGGCAVINVRYHAPTRTLVSVHCNGDA